MLIEQNDRYINKFFVSRKEKNLLANLISCESRNETLINKPFLINKTRIFFDKKKKKEWKLQEWFDILIDGEI